MRLLLRVLAIAGVLLAVVIGVMFGTWNYAIATAALSALLFIATFRNTSNQTGSSAKLSKQSDPSNATVIAGASITAHNQSNESSSSSSSFDAGSSGGADGGC